MIKFYIKCHFSELILLLKIQCQRGTWKLVYEIWKSARIDRWVHLTLLNFVHCTQIMIIFIPITLYVSIF